MRDPDLGTRNRNRFIAKFSHTRNLSFVILAVSIYSLSSTDFGCNSLCGGQQMFHALDKMQSRIAFFHVVPAFKHRYLSHQCFSSFSCMKSIRLQRKSFLLTIFWISADNAERTETFAVVPRG